MKLVVIAVGIVVSCKPSDGTLSPYDPAAAIRAAESRVKALTFDRSTPDRALQAYWALKDTIAAIDADTTLWKRNAYGAAQLAAFDSAYTGPALAELRERSNTTGASTRELFAREVIEVKAESETRAVVLARIRNVTPFPNDAVVSEYEKEARQNGETFRYIFEKAASGWRLSQIQRRSYPSDAWADHFTPNSKYVPTYVSP